MSDRRPHDSAPPNRRRPLRSRSERWQAKRRGYNRARNLARLRAGGRCEMPHGWHHDNCQRSGDDRLEAHHMCPRSLGGSDHVDNLLMVSSACHRMIHDRPKTARKLGCLTCE